MSNRRASYGECICPIGAHALRGEVAGARHGGVAHAGVAASGRADCRGDRHQCVARVRGRSARGQRLVQLCAIKIESNVRIRASISRPPHTPPPRTDNDYGRTHAIHEMHTRHPEKRARTRHIFPDAGRRG